MDAAMISVISIFMRFPLMLFSDRVCRAYSYACVCASGQHLRCDQDHHGACHDGGDNGDGSRWQAG
jgi:hypothetical protein